MPLRNDPALWFNVPGIVGAYQPVVAPNPNICRYNQAQGGSNLYRARDGVAPAWEAASGWTFTAASSQQLLTGIIPANNQTWSGLGAMAISAGTAGVYAIPFGLYYYTTGPLLFGIMTGYQIANISYFLNGGQLNFATGKSTGVFGVAGVTGYVNGIAVAGVTPTGPGAFIQIAIGSGNGTRYCNVIIRAVAIYNRTLSNGEVWIVSQQMAYCQINPEWSAWGRRRQWYYVKAPVTGWRGPVVGSRVIGGMIVRQK